MIVKIFTPTDPNIAITYGGRSYLCFAPVAAIGAVFSLASAVVVPTATSDSTFVNEVEVRLNELRPCIVDDNGNVYMEVDYYKENLSSTEPARV